MIQDFKTGVDMLLRVLNLHSEIIQRKRKRELILDFLTAYYCFSHIVKNGKDLLSIAVEEPIKGVMEMPEEARLKYASNVYSLLLTQKLLLSKLASLMSGQPIMELLDPMLKQDIENFVWSKQGGLLRARMALEWYFRWGITPSATFVKKPAALSYQARMVCMVLSDESRTVIDVEATQNNLNALEEAAERLRLRINEFCTLEESLEFCKKAEEIVSKLLPQSNTSFDRTA